MKLKINILHLKQIGLLLLLFIPIYLFFVKYGYGAVLFGISQKMYKHDNVTITLPWGWFNGRLKDEYPLFFNTYDKKDMIVFDYYENIDADNADKYEIAFIDKTNNSTHCYYADINSNETYLFKKRFENKFVIFAYIPNVRLEIFYESENAMPEYGLDDNHDKRIKRILSNIEIEKTGNKIYYDIDESVKSTIYSKCEELK